MRYTSGWYIALKNSTQEIKALALDALGIEVYTDGLDKLEILGVIPLELALPIIVQT